METRTICTTGNWSIRFVGFGSRKCGDFPDAQKWGVEDIKMATASNSRVLRIIPLILIVVLFCPFVHGKVIQVDDDGPADFDNIQAGIDAGIDGDTVMVVPGEYIITEPITFRGKAITVKSEAGLHETTIRMGTPADTNRGSVVVFENGETIASVLEGFTITGGIGTWFPSENARGGGGIFFDASSGTIANCTIVQNRADAGGGVISSANSLVTVSNCTIADNSVTIVGGGIVCWQNSTVTMTDCIVVGNSVTGTTPAIDGWGGGLYCGPSCSLTAVNCNIVENSAGVGGAGAMCDQNSLVTLKDCIIMKNSAEIIGGGIECTGSVTLTNCVIARNSSLRWAGGLSCEELSSSVIVNNCSFWANSATEEGGGVGCFNGASATVTNSIFLGNTAAKGNEIFLEESPTRFSVAYSNVAGGHAGIHVQGDSTLDWGVGNIDADPLFEDPNNDDFHLKSQAGRWDPNSLSWIQDELTSPCIDAGDPMSPINLESFPNGGFVNMGAYGGTSKASKAYFGEPVCETIIAGDINGDGEVNRTDLEIMALHWTDDEPLPLP